jgi:hypothetical protein
MSEEPERKRPKAPTPKNRRAPVPARKKGASDGEPPSRPRAPRKAGAAPRASRPTPPEGDTPTPKAPDAVAAQQAAAQQAAAQQAAAQRAAAEQAAAEKAAAEKAAAQKAAAQKAAAQKAAAQKAAAQKAAAQKAAAEKAAAAKAAAAEAAAQAAAAAQSAAPPAAAPPAAAPHAAPSRKAPAPRRAPAPRKAGATGKAPAPGAPRKAAAPSAGAAAAGKAPPRRPGAAPPARGGATRRPAPPRELAGGSEIELELEESASSRKPLIIAVSAIAVLGLLALVMLGGGDKPAEEVPATAAETPEPVVDPRIEESEQVLARLQEFQKNNPTEYSEIQLRYEVFARQYAGLPAAVQAQSLKGDIEKVWKRELDALRVSLEDELAKLERAREYGAALKLVSEPPAILEGADEVFSSESPMLAWLRTQEKRLKKLSLAYDRYAELERKAANYARDNYPEIAVEILEAFNEKYEQDAYEVWELKEKTVAKIRAEGIQSILDRQARTEEEAAAEVAAQKEKEREARERRWRERLSMVDWYPHIGRHNLYNWVVSSDRFTPEPRWRVLDRDGQGVLKGRNESGNNFLGIFTNHWQDYVLEFEMRLIEGSVILSPRTKTRGGGIAEETSPGLTFDEDAGVSLGDWTRISVIVNGQTAEATIDGSSRKLTVDTELVTLPESGGFLIRLGEGTEVELRNLRTKLVNSTRDNAYTD